MLKPKVHTKKMLVKRWLAVGTACCYAHASVTRSSTKLTFPGAAVLVGTTWIGADASLDSSLGSLDKADRFPMGQVGQVAPACDKHPAM